jgi:hypothetical protein
LPNSRMSAPAMKVRPADNRDGGDPGSLAALAMDNRIPSGTPGLKAFTGGLEMVIHATSLRDGWTGQAHSWPHASLPTGR